MTNIRGNKNADPQHDLRAAVATIEGELARLSTLQATEVDATRMNGLLASWATLLPLLELAPAPELRDCPVCGNIVMRAATLCGYCWSKLTLPLVATA